MTVDLRWFHLARVVLQTLIALAIEVDDNLPWHEYEQGAEIGLGLLLLTVAEVLFRSWRRTRDEVVVRPPTRTSGDR